MSGAPISYPYRVDLMARHSPRAPRLCCSTRWRYVPATVLPHAYEVPRRQSWYTEPSYGLVPAIVRDFVSSRPRTSRQGGAERAEDLNSPYGEMAKREPSMSPES